MKKPGLSAVIDSFQARGKYTFTKADILRQRASPPAAVKLALYRLARNKRILMIKQGFYVIIPLEYRASGCVPASWFVPDLMKSCGHQYYAGLLSAAAMHGAAHHQPQEFEVIIDGVERTIEKAGLRVRFFSRRKADLTPVQQIKTETGFLAVSTPAATAIDLVHFSRRIGGLNLVATVLRDLADRITPADLGRALAAMGSRSLAQRLGFILERMGKKRLARAIGSRMTMPPRFPALLDPARPARKAPRRPKWNIIENVAISGEP